MRNLLSRIARELGGLTEAARGGSYIFPKKRAETFDKAK
jgi:hypothetical protein